MCLPALSSPPHLPLPFTNLCHPQIFICREIPWEVSGFLKRLSLHHNPTFQRQCPSQSLTHIFDRWLLIQILPSSSELVKMFNQLKAFSNLFSKIIDGKNLPSLPPIWTQPKVAKSTDVYHEAIHPFHYIDTLHCCMTIFFLLWLLPKIQMKTKMIHFDGALETAQMVSLARHVGVFELLLGSCSLFFWLQLSS